VLDQVQDTLRTLSVLRILHLEAKDACRGPASSPAGETGERVRQGSGRDRGPGETGERARQGEERGPGLW